MVDDIVKSKEDAPLKLLCLEMLFQCSLFRLKELIKTAKKLNYVQFLFFGGGGGGGRKC